MRVVKYKNRKTAGKDEVTGEMVKGRNDFVVEAVQ